MNDHELAVRLVRAIRHEDTSDMLGLLALIRRAHRVNKLTPILTAAIECMVESLRDGQHD
jgi:hypothetical protein